MDSIIVYLDDAEFALQQLAPMKTGVRAPAGTHWVLVACPPRMARYVNKWVNSSARRDWRARWAEKVFQQVIAGLQAPGDRITRVIAEGSLVAQTQQLQDQLGAARVLDARRPKFGQELPPVVAGQSTDSSARWSLPGAVVGMGAVLVLAAE